MSVSRDALVDHIKIFSLGLSINAWTFGTITGFDYYKINPVIGVQDSLKVDPQ